MANFLQAKIEKFVSRLWQYARIKALGASQESLRGTVLDLKASLSGIDPNADWQAIGEELVVQILKYTVDQYARHNCSTCLNVCTAFDGSSRETCENFIEDVDAYQASLVQLYDAIFILDGSYGLEAGRMVSIVATFLDELRGPDDMEPPFG